MFEEITIATLFTYFMVFCRLGAGIMLLPGISEGYISSRGRLVLAIGLTIVVTPAVKHLLPSMPASVAGLLLIICGEIIIGVLIGSVAKTILAALNIAGSIIAYQTGLAAANFFDPSQGGQSSIISSFLTFTAIMLVFTTNMHHVFLRGLVDSYEIFLATDTVPIGGFSDLMAKTVSGSFAVGMRIAAPQIVVGLMLYLGAGVMSRLMPQMQVFFVMMPIQIALGFFMLMVTLSASMFMFMDYYAEIMGNFIK